MAGEYLIGVAGAVVGTLIGPPGLCAFAGFVGFTIKRLIVAFNLDRLLVALFAFTFGIFNFVGGSPVLLFGFTGLALVG